MANDKDLQTQLLEEQLREIRENRRARNREAVGGVLKSAGQKFGTSLLNVLKPKYKVTKQEYIKRMIGTAVYNPNKATMSGSSYNRRMYGRFKT